MWKIQDFCITQILREINFVNSRSAKTAVFANLGAVNFVHLVNCQIPKYVPKFRETKCVKITHFPLLESQNLISRKIWVIEKSWNFHIVFPFSEPKVSPKLNPFSNCSERENMYANFEFEKPYIHSTPFIWKSWISRRTSIVRKLKTRGEEATHDLVRR